MKKYICLLLILLSGSSPAEDRKLSYTVEKGDTFGTVVFSLGYKRLWSGSAYVNKFKNKISPNSVNKVDVGDKVYFNESEIIFKKNVKIVNDRIYFHKKVRKLKEWKELMALEEIQSSFPEPSLITLEKTDETTTVYTREKFASDFYLGGGGFIASDTEADRSSQTKTMTGLQPVLQFKGIFSHLSFGSVAFDFFAKKIITSEFSFPINTDFRLQFIPKWIDLGPVNLAFSYSTIRHSYVGKPEDEEVAYELSANFVGIGIVWPRGTYWYELYLEKAVSGRTESDQQDISLNDGWRLDSELIYPISKNLRFIPGLNYYKTKNTSENYQMSVLELRSTIAWEF